MPGHCWLAIKVMQLLAGGHCRLAIKGEEAARATEMESRDGHDGVLQDLVPLLGSRARQATAQVPGPLEEHVTSYCTR